MLKKIFSLFVATLTLCAPVGAVSVRLVALNEVIDSAAIVFQGTCTGNRIERDTTTNLIVTYTTFAVSDHLKGDVSSVHTIKQIGGEMPAGELSFKVSGVPNFVVGEEYVVFLAGVSAAGFSSPVGLAQGKFFVQTIPAGKQVSNGRDFRTMMLTPPSAAVPDAKGQAQFLGLDDFKQIVRARVAGQQ